MLLKVWSICFIILSLCKNVYSQTYMIQKTEKEWLQELGPDRYHVLRQKGTEPPFSGTYNTHFKPGNYVCAACKNPLFNHTQKFESHCGWPSFDDEIGNGTNIIKITDRSHGMIRTEICCSKCGGHLGHVFDDGPTATKLRYCVNSLSLEFISNSAQSK